MSFELLSTLLVSSSADRASSEGCFRVGYSCFLFLTSITVFTTVLSIVAMLQQLLLPHPYKCVY